MLEKIVQIENRKPEEGFRKKISIEDRTVYENKKVETETDRKKLNWLEEARSKLKKIEEKKIESKTPKKRKNIYSKVEKLTPGSNRKTVKRISEKKATTIKDLWGGSKENSDRKKSKKKLGIETDVRKLIDGIESSLETNIKVVGNGTVDSLSTKQNQTTKIESHEYRIRDRDDE